MFLALSFRSFAFGGLRGTIYASNFDGSRINQNMYPSKTSVYLNGSLPVWLAAFNDTPTAGDEYKVTLIRADAPGVSADEDGFHID